MASPISFQGITSGVKTDALVNAMIAQEGRGVAALEARQTKNTAKAGALSSMKLSLNSFSVSLAVLQDKISSGSSTTVDSVQEVISKFNTLVKTYKESSATTRNSDGSINPGILSGDAASRETILNLRNAFTKGTSGSTEHPNLFSIGIKTLADGSLSLNTSEFQAALASDPAAVKTLLSFTDLKTAVTTATASSNTSPLTNTLKQIEIQNVNLATQISSGKALLERRRKILTDQFSKMESIIGQLKAAAGSLSVTV